MDVTHEIEIIISKDGGFSEEDVADLKNFINERAKKFEIIDFKSLEAQEEMVVILIHTSRPGLFMKEVEPEINEYCAFVFYFQLYIMKLEFETGGSWLNKKVKIESIKISEILFKKMNK